MECHPRGQTGVIGPRDRGRVGDAARGGAATALHGDGGAARAGRHPDAAHRRHHRGVGAQERQERQERGAGASSWGRRGWRAWPGRRRPRWARWGRWGVSSWTAPARSRAATCATTLASCSPSGGTTSVAPYWPYGLYGRHRLYGHVQVEGSALAGGGFHLQRAPAQFRISVREFFISRCLCILLLLVPVVPAVRGGGRRSRRWRQQGHTHV